MCAPNNCVSFEHLGIECKTLTFIRKDRVANKSFFIDKPY